ncbi:MAG: hypothetical protein NUV68_05450 [Caldiserica bacterium]|jgi:hypothetical protein|nr:hypothetical protein [Caldisericota bacterium]MDH7562773.1 hypothetical protein [Caldisericota bacterium]
MRIPVEKDSVLKGLNAFKAIAKQDVLVANTTDNPEFWQRHAEARRQIYKTLISLVEEKGVDAACAQALSDYRVLSQSHDETPESKGKIEALENFLGLCGFDERAIKQSQSK